LFWIPSGCLRETWLFSAGTPEGIPKESRRHPEGIPKESRKKIALKHGKSFAGLKTRTDYAFGFSTPKSQNRIMKIFFMLTGCLEDN
jgi:hypothetical protein